MTGFPFRVESLGAQHDRTEFRCGEGALDQYFQTQVSQDIRRRVTNCFVAVEAVTGLVAAYYTISAASVPLTELPPDITKRLPRYPTVPAVLVGRLAVDEKFQARGLGAALLSDAARRTVQAAPAAFAILVNADDDRAVAFCQHHGFRPIAGHPRTLFLPVATAERALFKQTIG
jgi:GNAT superfamily N-acetyltransferase